MVEANNDKSLKVRHIREVLIPELKKVFATKEDLEDKTANLVTKEDLEASNRRALETFAAKQDLKGLVTKSEFKDFRGEMTDFKSEMNDFKTETAERFDKVLTGQDQILGELETLRDEKTVAGEQKKRERRFYAIIVDALKEHQILSSERLEQIKKLNIF